MEDILNENENVFTANDIIEILQEDLKNERKHMLFYMQSAVLVRGLHRTEYAELFEKEALDEHKHVLEFSGLIAKLGGVPGTENNDFPNLTDPKEIIAYARDMEQEVADRYAARLEFLSDKEKTGIPYFIQLFYEDQLQDSQDTALEFNLLVGKQ